MWGCQSRIAAAHRKDREVTDKAEEINSTVRHFRTIMRADIKMLDEDLKSMVDELATLNVEMSKAKDYMDSAKVLFLSAHGITFRISGSSWWSKIEWAISLDRVKGQLCVCSAH